MLLRYLSAAAVALQSAHAFQDASPFFLFSTDKVSSFDANVASAETVKSEVSSAISGCSSKTYVVVSQPGVLTADFQSTPHLRRHVSVQDDRVVSAVTINNVAKAEDLGAQLMSMLETTCGNNKAWNMVTLTGEAGVLPSKADNAVHVRFPELPLAKADRDSALLQADSYLNSLLSYLDSYTVLYTTTPASSVESVAPGAHLEQYEMDEPYPSAMHIDLKRDLDAHVLRSSNSSNSSNPQANLPLFEKYQFLSPGIFMGGAVSLLLFIILYVGISAIAGLEVSYMAFSKEMGPAAQKKQQ